MNLAIYKMSIGTFMIAADNDAITMVKLIGFDDPPSIATTSDPPHDNSPSGLTDLAAKQLEEYLNGNRREFDLPLKTSGTVFQQAVWEALKSIPYGQTRSYKQVALMINKPNACRAVGMANNKNPIWIIIPCHRVIGSNGSLVGYGGGLDNKRKLLLLENPGFIE